MAAYWYPSRVMTWRVRGNPLPNLGGTPIAKAAIVGELWGAPLVVRGLGRCKAVLQLLFALPPAKAVRPVSVGAVPASAGRALRSRVLQTLTNSHNGRYT